MDSGLGDALAALRDEWRLDFRLVERVLAALAEPVTLTAAVERSGASRAQVLAVLDTLGPAVRTDGDRRSLVAAVPARAAPDPAALLDAVRSIAAGLPPSRWSLDHVPATPETIADRALHLARTYALAGRTVLCVGDHDLTSVAVTLAEPAARALVVDVDERLLEFLGAVAAERGLPIVTAFADLRVGLPRSLAGRADLAVTDPPYTPAGVALFVRRALDGLDRTGHERVVLAYGFADGQLTRGFRTQSVLHELRLVVEALLPGFNRYAGAEAIGSVSDLYALRPTRWTWSTVDRAGPDETRIYTRGVAAEEAADPAPAPEVLAAVRTALGAAPSTVDLVGPGWPAAWGGGRDLAELVRPDPEARAARHRPLAVNLTAHSGALLPRVLIVAAGRPVVVVAAPRDIRSTGVTDPSDPVGALLARLRRTTTVHSGQSSVLVSTPLPAESDVDGVLAYLAAHPAATLLNAWRDALLGLARRRGTALTKNEARALARGSGIPAGALELRLTELPRGQLARLLDAARASVAALRDQCGVHGPRPAGSGR